MNIMPQPPQAVGVPYQYPVHGIDLLAHDRMAIASNRALALQNALPAEPTEEQLKEVSDAWLAAEMLGAKRPVPPSPVVEPEPDVPPPVDPADGDGDDDVPEQVKRMRRKTA